MKKFEKLGITKIELFMLCAVIVIVGFYATDYFFSRSTGEIKTEPALIYTYKDVIEVDGFAVRDEAHISGDTNLSVLTKDEGKVYVPVIKDGENVSKNGVVAIAFDTQQQAQNYLKVKELEAKLDSVSALQYHEGLDYKNVMFLNSQISSNISDYISMISSSKVGELSDIAKNIAENITKKQIAVGNKLDLSAIINQYEKEINTLKATYSTDEKITSPYAGYFVSETDGFENIKSYDDVKNKIVTSGEATALSKRKAVKSKNAYGKIISQHSWYYIFDVKINEASFLKTGYWANVSFEEIGVYDIDMLVYDISELKDGIITVTFKCTTLNEKLASMRKGKATISVTQQEYTGFRIRNEAITENEKGLRGVYAVVGNVVKFSPLEVKYYGDGFVIAKAYVPQAKENETREEEEYRESLHLLKQHDEIIVKGINLKDGIIID